MNKQSNKKSFNNISVALESLDAKTFDEYNPKSSCEHVLKLLNQCSYIVAKTLDGGEIQILFQHTYPERALREKCAGAKALRILFLRLLC